jgi:hypothetical protein
MLKYYTAFSAWISGRRRMMDYVVSVEQARAPPRGLGEDENHK